jgi:hypothetical protein
MYDAKIGNRARNCNGIRYLYPDIGWGSHERQMFGPGGDRPIL